jgi:uncharacterized protein (DUF1778 family)
VRARQRFDGDHSVPYICRTGSVMAASNARNKRLEVRTTEEERALIDRAVQAAGVELSTFVVRELVAAARELLADRAHFTLSPEAREEWERINRRPARDLPGLRRLMQRPSPFTK